MFVDKHETIRNDSLHCLNQMADIAMRHIQMQFMKIIFGDID